MPKRRQSQNETTDGPTSKKIRLGPASVSQVAQGQTPPNPTPIRTALPARANRKIIQGQIQRLGPSHPSPHISSKDAKCTLAGAKIGGKAKDLKKKDSDEGEEMWVSRKGLPFSGVLKKGVACFLENGSPSLTLHALGVAIPLCLTVAFAIASALPCGVEGLDIETKTESVVVNDAILLEGQNMEYEFQKRTKSAIHVTLKLKKEMASMIADPMRTWKK